MLLKAELKELARLYLGASRSRAARQAAGQPEPDAAAAIAALADVTTSYTSTYSPLQSASVPRYPPEYL